MKTQQNKRAAQLLKTLGNQYRFQIITLLMQKETHVNELLKSVKISQPAMSQHLNRLRLAGIVKARRDSRFIYYSMGDITTPPVAIIYGIVRTLETEQL